jgi:hypothetical protein
MAEVGRVAGVILPEAGTDPGAAAAAEPTGGTLLAEAERRQEEDTSKPSRHEERCILKAVSME